MQDLGQSHALSAKKETSYLGLYIGFDSNICEL